MFSFFLIFLLSIVGIYAICSITSGGTATSILLKRVRLHMEAGNVDAALRCLEDALELEPENPDALYAVGSFCVSIGNIHRSNEILERLVAIDSNIASDLAHEVDQFVKNNPDKPNQDTNHFDSTSDLILYYNILEVEVGASKDNIRKAYREMVKVWHPDRFEHDSTLKLKAQNKMKLINEAYNVINQQVS